MGKSGRAVGKDNNFLSGTNGNDVLNGNGTSYTLSGGKGDDRYFIDDAGDLVIEKNNGGWDQVYSYIDTVLADNVEALTLQGDDHLAGTGNQLNNEIVGNNGNNLLDGAGGSNRIDGGEGEDTAVFAGLAEEHDYIWVEGSLHIIGPNGDTDILTNVEYLSFEDSVIAVADLRDEPPLPPEPLAVDDAGNTMEENAFFLDVLGNDVGEGLSISTASNGSKGTVEISSEGKLIYRPTENAFGQDVFTYTIIDSMGRESSATVEIVIEGVNDAPVATSDSYTIREGVDLVETSSVLTNDFDPDGDALQVTGANGVSASSGQFAITTEAGGTAQINADGTFTYTPAAGFIGTDTFSYQVEDGSGLSDSALVELLVEPATTDGEVPYYVTGLLADNDWNRMNWPSEVGSETVVTYAFLDGVPSYYVGWSADETTFQQFTASQQYETRVMLEEIGNVTGITFVETTAAEAGLTFGTIQLGATEGLAFDATGAGIGSVASDVWLDADVAGTEFSDTAKTILLHEIGHALGLEHATLPDGEDTQQYTVMSGIHHPGGDGTVDALQLYDIAALQHLYGANNAHAAGDDVYTFQDLDGRAISLWDGGGRDVLDMSDATSGVELDLREGAFSTTGGTNDSNLSIAFGTEIEDAIGSEFDDSLTGNDGDNFLNGGGGNDTLTGGAGQDTYGFESGWGQDRISDFAVGEDRLDFSGTELTLEDLFITSGEGNTYVSDGENLLTLEGVDGIDEELEQDLIFF